MLTFEEWKYYYESHAEPADPIEGASLYFELHTASSITKSSQAALQKGDQDAVDAINKQQLKVARDALKMYKE